MSPAKIPANFFSPLGAEEPVYDLDHGALIGRRADRQMDARRVGLVDDAVDPAAHRQLAGRNDLHEDIGLQGVQMLDERVAVRDWNGPAGFLEIGAHPFLAAGDLEQDAVQLHVPHVFQTRGGEGAVEGDPMPVPLGVGENAVAIEDQCIHERASSHQS